MVRGVAACEDLTCESDGAGAEAVTGDGLAGRALACPSAPVTVASGKNRSRVVDRTPFM